jgi:hypothetical protein
MMEIPSPSAVVVPHLLPVAVSTHLHALPVATVAVDAINAVTMDVSNVKKLMNNYAKELLNNTKNANRL